MTVRSALPVVIVAGLLTIASYLAITPNFAFGALLNAAASSDDARLTRQVNIPAVRAHLTEQARSAAGGAVPALLAPFAQAIGASVTAAALEALLTPQGLRELLGVGPDRGLDPRAIRELHDRARRDYRAWNRYAVTAPSPLTGGDVTYVFGRTGLGWELVALEF
jgi:hypothetical protein